MSVFSTAAANASVATNATNHLQEAMMASAASVLFVLLLLPALARNQSIGYAPPYLPYGTAAAATAALPAAYPAFGYPALPGGYPGLGAAAALPPVYAPAGSLAASPPFSLGGVGVGAVAGAPAGYNGFTGYGFPAGWPARPLGPIAAALATAYPTLFSVLSGPCRSWCRAPTLPLLFPPSPAESEQLLAERPVLRLLKAMFSDDDKAERGPLLRLFFPEE